MTQLSKTLIFKFFLKIPGCVREKKTPLARWRKTWRSFHDRPLGEEHRTINSRYDTALENLEFQVFLKNSRVHDLIKSVARSSTEIAWFSPSSYHRSLRLTSNNLTESSAGFLSSISWSNRDIRRDRGNFVKFLVASQVDFFFNHASWTFRKKLEIEGFRRPCHI